MRNNHRGPDAYACQGRNWDYKAHSGKLVRKECCTSQVSSPASSYRFSITKITKEAGSARFMLERG